MDLSTARVILGVSATVDWGQVRQAYRSRIRQSHPDLAGTHRLDETLQLNAAYRALSIARREGRLEQVAHDSSDLRRDAGVAPTASMTEPAAASGAPADVQMSGTDTLVLSSTPAESFRRLVEATHQIGELSYIDRSAAIFEAVLILEDGKAASFVVSLQWRSHDATCEAFCTLEALDRAEHLDPSGVLAQLVQFLPPDQEDV